MGSASEAIMCGVADPYERLAAEVVALVGVARPVLVGIAGGVGVGKSTTAARIEGHLSAAAVTVEVVGTDAFLLPNDELERRDLGMRKGFPESFDTGALESFLRAVRAGAPDVRVPVYSHTTYDRVPDTERVVGPADVLIVEGVNALQPPVVDELDVAVYIDAAEEDMAAWFVERFLAFCEEARDDDESFYRGFVGMSAAQQRGIAEWTWREINLVNLREHIAPSQARATVVLSKRRDHSVRS
jgi:type I pantothenate kinase